MNPVDFIHDLTWDDIPPEVRHQAKRCLLDTLGVAIGARGTATARIMYEHVARFYGGEGGWLWLDGRQVSMPGAALAHGMMIDALDMHDSCRPVKGHAGVALVPAALATLGVGAADDISGQELLTTLVMAYDIAIRTGTAQHATVCDYHTSGSWNALGCAAIVARRLGLSREQTRHALGIAEYHGPRSQMMRVIDYPSMLKDGSGWGAMAGVSAGFMAADGFTGAPAITVEADNVREYWADLGQRWSLMLQYFKPHAVCYWAQPAVAGALKIQREQQVKPEEIKRIRVYTFHESARLAMRRPLSTDEAQYSLPFPVGAALVYGRLTLPELSGEALHNPEVLRLSDMVELVEDDVFNARFPADRLSRVEMETQDGRVFDSGEMTALWGDLANPPTDEELLAKFHELARTNLSEAKTAELAEAIWYIETADSVADLVQLLAQTKWE